jgi:hypothetical protein
VKTEIVLSFWVVSYTVWGKGINEGWIKTDSVSVLETLKYITSHTPARATIHHPCTANSTAIYSILNADIVIILSISSLYLYLFIHPSVWSFFPPSICLITLFLSVSSSSHLLIYLSNNVPTYPRIYIYIYIYIYMSVCVCVCVCVEAPTLPPVASAPNIWSCKSVRKLSRKLWSLAKTFEKNF